MRAGMLALRVEDMMKRKRGATRGEEASRFCEREFCLERRANHFFFPFSTPTSSFFVFFYKSISSASASLMNAA